MVQNCWNWLFLYHKWFTSCERKNGFVFCLLTSSDLITTWVLLNFSFALMQKKQKNIHALLLFFCMHESSISLLENQKRKNYLKAPFRSPSRSPFRLNLRTAATLLYPCFLFFLFKGEIVVVARSLLLNCSLSF